MYVCFHYFRYNDKIHVLQQQNAAVYALRTKRGITRMPKSSKTTGPQYFAHHEKITTEKCEE